MASFTRTATTGALAQKTGTAACVVFLLANGCSLGRAMNAPEGLTVAPDGGELYVAAFTSGAIDTLIATGSRARSCRSRAGRAAWSSARHRTARPDAPCSGASSVAVSPDGRNLYATAFSSDAVGVFKRVTRGS